jgi:ubiquitin-conjugating enzyme E2 variant
MGQGSAPRTQLIVAIDVMAVGVVTAGLAVIAARVWHGIQWPIPALGVAATMAVGYGLADLLTGFVHWFFDTFFDETTPLLGPRVIAPFREHHRDPLAMTRHGFLELTGTQFLAMAPLTFAVVWWGDSVTVFGNAFALAFVGGAVVTNLFHRWAHEPVPPPLARVLQTVGLVLTPERHANHHSPPHTAAYCVTSGWLNPMCDRLRIWTRAEAALTALGLPLSGGDRR